MARAICLVYPVLLFGLYRSGKEYRHKKMIMLAVFASMVFYVPAAIIYRVGLPVRILTFLAIVCLYTGSLILYSDKQNKEDDDDHDQGFSGTVRH